MVPLPQAQGCAGAAVEVMGMPFRSKAQMRWMFWAEKQGKLPKGTARRWAHETPNIKRLPERVGRRRRTARRKKR